MPSWLFSDRQHFHSKRNIMDSGSSSALTIESVRMALGASSLRQKVIADNIANVGSTNHTRMRVVFEESLAQALQAARAGGSSVDMSTISSIQAEVEPDPYQGPVQLDEEVARLSANSTRYGALSKGISRYLSIASLIASGSKG
jgi:flagellar basal-body rod protein FlgB